MFRRFRSTIWDRSLCPTTNFSQSGTVLATLGPSPDSRSYVALPIRDTGAYVGRDQHGHAAVFLPCLSLRRPLSLGTNHLSLTLGASCSLTLPANRSFIGRFNLLHCNSDDAPTVETFALLADALIAQTAEETFSPDALISFFRGFSKLFQVDSGAAHGRVRQGLWGELFLMRALGGPSRWIRYWHSTPLKRWDFSYGNRHIEVKASRGVAHAHTFAHRQLFYPSSEEVLIASILLQEDSSGISLGALLEHARRELRTDLEGLLKLETAARQAGITFGTDDGPTFDELETEKRLRWFWASETPRFPQREPAGVSDTHYRVDLSGLAPIPAVVVAEWLQNWGAV